MQTLLIAFIAYLTIGILVTWMLSQTPYSDNGWIETALLWPVYLFVFLFR